MPTATQHKELMLKLIELEIAIINKERIKKKGDWLFISSEIYGVPYIYKGFNTYIQRLIINKIDHGNVGDITVKAFKEVLRNAFEYHLVKESK